MVRSGGGARVLALSAAGTLIVLGFTAPAGADPGDGPPRELDVSVVHVRAADFVDEAAALPADLTAAIRRDLDITPAEYLARAQAAVDAVGVVAALEVAGVDVLGSELDGTELVVYVPDAATADLVETTGARAEVGEPAPFDLGDRVFEVKDDVRGGMPYVYDGPEDDQMFRCSLGFSGVAVSTGASQTLTAGHCEGNPASPRYTIVATRPGVFPAQGPVAYGPVVAGSFHFGDGYDFGLLAPAASRNAVPEVLTWGNGAGAPLASAPLKVRDSAPAVEGAPLCRSGSTSGWRCGEILDVNVEAEIGGPGGPVVRGIAAEVCLLQGDSGGPALMGAMAIGINSASSSGAGCASGDVALFTALYSPSAGLPSADAFYAGAWEPKVAVERPTLTAPVNGIHTGASLTGKVPFGNVRHRVEVVIDGSIARTGSVDALGAWSIDVSDLPPGAHEFSMRARWGERSRSSVVSGGWIDDVPERLYGASRYETAVEISQEAFPSGPVPVVFIASGLNYPDALSAGPAAAALGGPLLLTPTGSLPAAVRAELERLQPARIVIAGGTGAVSSAVATALRAYASGPDPIVRLGGANRYETSRLIADYAFDLADTAFIATGRNFPDALSAGAAGASLGAPVILVNGAATTADAATRALLTELGVDEILIAGGTGVVSSGIQANLATVALTTRLSGAGRYDTSLAINDHVFASADSAFLTYGGNFPDALAGSVLAGLRGGPMYIVPGTCVPPAIVAHLIDLGVDEVTLLGGPGILTSGVAALKRC